MRQSDWTVEGIATPYRLVLVVSSLLCAALISLYMVHALANGVPSEFADKDFANYWIAARLVLQGEVGDLFGSQATYFQHLQDVFGQDYPWHNWSYPPHYLLLVWPLGFVGYKTGVIAFLIVTGALYAWALRELTERANLLIVAAAAPFVIVNIWAAQNGFLTGALALGCLACREKRPIVAGILLGILTIKPQLGILFPIFLIAERRWLVILSATVSTLFLVVVSALIFGLDSWYGYINNVVPYQTFVMKNFSGLFLTMMPSIYGSARLLDIAAGPALVAHFVVALPTAVLAIFSFFKIKDSSFRVVILLLSTFLVSPYALNYDLGLLAASLAIFASYRAQKFPFQLLQDGLLAIAMLLPVAMMIVGRMGVGIAPLVLLAVFILVLLRAGFWRRVSEHAPLSAGFGGRAH